MKLIDIMNITSINEFKNMKIMFESEELDFECTVSEIYERRHRYLDDDALRFRYFTDILGHIEIKHINVYDGKLLIWL